jgi:hypothetical protein
VCERDSLGAVVDAELCQDPLNVSRDCLRADEKARRDRILIEPLRQESEDLALAGANAGLNGAVESPFTDEAVDPCRPSTSQARVASHSKGLLGEAKMGTSEARKSRAIDDGGDGGLWFMMLWSRRSSGAIRNPNG